MLLGSIKKKKKGKEPESSQAFFQTKTFGELSLSFKECRPKFWYQMQEAKHDI